MAQAAGLGLRGGFSITTSPAQERAGRGAAPRAARARAGGGRGAILGRARAREREPLGAALGRSVPKGPTQCHPGASVSPPRKPHASSYACAGFPGPTALPTRLPTPAQPGTALHPEAPESPCAPAGPRPAPPWGDAPTG